MYDALQSLKFPDVDDTGEYNQAIAKFSEYLKSNTKESVEDIAVDYAKIFLGAGIAEGASAIPYASVYTSPKKIIMQEEWSEVNAIYVQHKLERSGEAKQLMEDHIAVELSFMAYLAAEESVEENKFLEEHILNWVPEFCEDISKYAMTEFYRIVGELTISYVKACKILNREEELGKYSKRNGDEQ